MENFNRRHTFVTTVRLDLAYLDEVFGYLSLTGVSNLGLDQIKAVISVKKRCENVLSLNFIWLRPRVLFLLCSFHRNPDHVVKFECILLLGDVTYRAVAQRELC